MRDSWLAFVAPSVPALRFAVKTLLAAGLALWLAMRFDLEQPQWALMTVFVVAQPLSGMVVQKGLARLLGTLLGGLVSLLIMGLFAQAPWLFLLATALWLGLCIGAASQFRSAWAYAFMLSGYTVVIIVMPALSEPLSVFEHAVARCTEIGLAICCATAVSAILWPQQIQRDLLAQARTIWQAGLRTAQATLAGESEARQGLLELLGRIVALDMQREHAWFEGYQGRQRARGMHSLSRSLLSMLRVARAVARQWRDLSASEARSLASWLQAVEAALRQPLEAQLQHLRHGLWAAARKPELNASQRYCLRRLALLLDHVAAAGRALQATEQARTVHAEPGVLAAHRDLRLALVFGSRGTLAFLALASFWLATGWTGINGAILLLAVICSLFASFPNAVQVAFSFLRGVLLAIPVAFVVGQVLLPQLSGFAMLALVLGVPLFFGALGMAHRPTAGTATAFSLNSIALIMPVHFMDGEYDTGLFFNEALGMLVGVGCAVMAYRLIGLRDPLWHGQRLRLAGLADLRRLTRRSLAGADLWFAGRMADRLLQLARHGAELTEEQRRHWDSGLFMLDLGDELLHLRLSLSKAGLRQPGIEAALRALENALHQEPAAERAGALDQPCRVLLRAFGRAPRSEHQSLAEAAVLQIRQSWRQWCRQQEGVHGVA